MYINSYVIMALVALVLGLIVAYKIVYGLLSAIRGSKAGPVSRSFSMSNLLLIAGSIYILFNIFQGSSQKNDTVPEVDDKGTQVRNLNVSPEQKRTTVPYPKPRYNTENSSNDFSFDQQERDISSRDDEFNHEEDYEISPMIYSDSYFIQIGCTTELSDAISYASKYEKEFELDYVYIGVIGKEGYHAMAYKILLKQHLNQEDAQIFLRENKKNLPSGSWVRSRYEFDKFYFI